MAQVKARHRKDTKESQSEMIDELCHLSPEIKNAADLACRFLQLVRGRQSEQLSAWIIDVERSGVAELKAFARGLEQDRAAVNAALFFMQWPWRR